MRTTALGIAAAVALAFGAIASTARAHVYWAVRAAGSGTTIGRAALDGSEPNQSFITGASGPVGIAVDSAHVYWANTFGGATIGRAALDGSEPNQSFITGAAGPCGVAVDGAHVYWGNFATGTIGRAALDGSEPNQSFITGANGPCGVAVDGSHVYWANEGFGGGGTTIGRANLDGSAPDQSFITGASEPIGVAVDGSHVYWGDTDGFAGTTIGRANLDGSGPNQSFITGASCPDLPAVDGAHVYWSNACSDTIGRANLDGSEPDQSFIETQSNPGGVAVDAEAEPSPTSPSQSPPSSVPTAPSATPPRSAPAAPPDFSTAVFDGMALRIRLKCPARFKPRCAGTASAVTRAGAKGAALSQSVSAAQKAGGWKVVALKVKPKWRSLVAKMAAHPGKKQLIVRQLIHANRFRDGHRQAVLHRYRVRSG